MLRFIHVGKCAGTSVRKFLLAKDIEFQEYHCYDANVKLAERILGNNKDDFYLLTVRDPIRRYISAFYWDFYEKRIKSDSKGPHGIWTEIYNVFQSPNALAEALTSDDGALKTFAQSVFHKSRLHMEFTLAWYISPDLAEKLNKENTFVIRTESVNRDMTDYMKKYHDEPEIIKLPHEKADYKSSIPNYDESLSPKALQNIKNIYADDYRVLDVLKSKKILDPSYLTIQNPASAILRDGLV